uniref:Aminotransferase putative n=1 Tax=Albugo laibachii Nc14 TaxID=890382 RepID=F0W9E5_9STRA|nr:aminotransferase putative [Albugo laibachii Nc14]|eukprot:CCA17759.1 aminotransferase putative [Albugo laibachii Nc14]
MGDYGQYVVPKADEMINFKVGQPAESLLPLETIREAAAIKFAENDRMFLQYGHIYGYPKFRQTLAAFLSKGYNANVDPEKLFITNGVTGGLALICSLFCQAGDLVFMEEPTYFLALSIMKDFKLNVRQIRMEQDGLDVDELEKWLIRGVIPKILYTIPTCHNPTGRTLSAAKREKLVQLSIQYRFLIVADEVYQLLSFPHVIPPPPMFTFDTHATVLALGSFSKILAPAVRLGWVQASPKLLSKLAQSGQLDSSGGINPVISGIVHAAIASGKQQEHLQFAINTLSTRAEALLTQLQASLPSSVTLEKPNGGYFVLVRLPDHLNAADLLPIAQKHKVMFLPGSSFSNSMKNYLRLSFSWYDIPDLELGARRLSSSIEEFLAMQTQSIVSPITSKCRIAVHGARGRLGSLIVQMLIANEQYAGEIDLRSHEPLSQSNVDVIIDVTLPDGTKTLLTTLMAASQHPPLIIGTTGSLPMDLIHSYAAKAPVVLRSNFSKGVPLLCDLARVAAFHLSDEWNVHIDEMHHTKKIDAPSGTAKTILQSVVSTGAPCTLNGIPTTSMRLGDEVGQHTIFFGGPGERIEIKHQATSRNVFAIGAIRVAKEAVQRVPGVYFH